MPPRVPIPPAVQMPLCVPAVPMPPGIPAVGIIPGVPVPPMPPSRERSIKLLKFLWSN
jgi:hypothetical protein